VQGGEHMQSGVYSIEELKTLLAPAFGAYPVRRGYVFGSYSRGAATEISDIDLFIEPSDGFRSYEVCGILSRAMKLTGKGVDCYSSFDFDEDAPIYKTILKDKVLIYGGE
jgi:predicted nucleotidyltransferase